MRRLVLVALFLAAFWPSAANAAVPCRNRIYNDWYGDGKIATTYPISCYEDALKHVHSDARIYSSLIDDIKSAMQAARERERGAKTVPTQVGRGLTSVSDTTSTVARGGVEAKHITLRPSAAKTQKNNRNGGTSTVASAPTSSSGGIPTPILVLGALALLLAAIGAAGTGVRRYRRR
jgi:hypothetical protein